MARSAWFAFGEKGKLTNTLFPLYAIHANHAETTSDWFMDTANVA